MQKFLLGVVTIAALIGWVMAFLSTRESNELENRLAASKAEITNTLEQLTDTQSRLALTRGAASSLEDIDKRVAEKRTEAGALSGEIKANRRELETLHKDLESGKGELRALAVRVAESKAELSRLAQNQEGAKTKLDRLRAESERQREAMISSPAETQTAAQAPKAPTAPATAPAPTEVATAAAKPAVDSLADAKRRFARVDQDGDGRFDRLDFRLKRVSLFGRVDANEDNYLTLDETLLSPGAFQIFDSDGDGKISSAEMADRKKFSVMDTDHDEFISFEEYVKLLRVSSE